MRRKVRLRCAESEKPAPCAAQILFAGAGHVLQLQKPHEVAQVILGLVATPEGS
jgi:hypothetical protein